MILVKFSATWRVDEGFRTLLVVDGAAAMQNDGVGDWRDDST